MILYIYTGAPDPARACATSLADLAALVAALQDPSTPDNAATLARISASIPQLGLNDDEPLELRFYSSASTEESWPADAANSVAVSLGLLTTDGSQALAATTADTIASTYRTGYLALTTSALKGYLLGWARRGFAQLWLHIRRTDASGYRTTQVLMPVQVSCAVLNSAITSPDPSGSYLTAAEIAALYLARSSTLGDIVYGGPSAVLTALPGNTAASLSVLTQTGTGSASAAPAWLGTTGTGNIARAISPTFTVGLTLTGFFNAGTVASGDYAGAKQITLFHTTLDGENGHLDVRPTITGTQTSNRYGMFLAYSVNTTGNHSWANGALIGQLSIDTGADLANRQSGLYGSIMHDGAGLAAWTLGGYFLNAVRAAGSITSADGLYSKVFINAASTGSITTAAGLRIGAFTNGGSGSFGTIYGIYIEAPTAAASTKAWGIYQAGAQANYLGGPTHVAGSVAVGNMAAADADDSPPVFPSSASLWVSNNVSGGLLVDSYGSGANGIPQVVFRRANGSLSSPSAALSGDSLGIIAVRAYGADAFSSGARGLFGIKATQNWTNANQGTAFVIETTPNGSTSRAEVARFTDVTATLVGTITTAAGVAWNLGAVAAVSPTTPNRTVAVVVAGTTIYLHGKTTND